MDNLPDLSSIWQQTLNWEPNLEKKAQFQQLYQKILQGNRELNLTRITSPRDFWEKHLWDSLAGITSELIDWQQSLKAIDIGTGAGFPGMAIAIALPHWRVTLLDSTRKKVAFLDQLYTSLGLANIETIAARAEELHKQAQYQQGYDLALVRAVGSTSVCVEYALPLVKIGGLAILYRGHWSELEDRQLPEIVSNFGGRVEQIKELSTPLSQSTRHYLYVRKKISNLSY
ncbi:16S rRNA (guanine(527)-N(7))-methyltransferase RsmG [Gloeocapsa sp. PCC 73106]|uniref:16S rRNA (guanine(527)-N(7))-methyltransferase RsmG n=1 Tax=Gloeocapsa sp. PCC 73106 TaxID=102232 RepID=UPI0002AC1D09|nr:16S rRNA (guanine(527)-N(7))-methyltransferase RsmG [Gloeocapsa sp. PCC 73106]ELR99937.1 16S rRNA (guanine(527)-N(7))-methyltransferase GidB [Gloeocapsa sp. PCC 73106]